MARLISLLCCLVCLQPAAWSAGREISARKGMRLAQRLHDERVSEREGAARDMMRYSDPEMLPALLDTLFFTEFGREETASVMAETAGQDEGASFWNWVLIVGAMTDLQAKDGYLAYKAEQFAKIDPAQAAFFNEDYVYRVRPWEIIFGGVGVDAIPPLTDPAFISAARASAFLTAKERVYGVSIDGEQRAYPLRILAWHEVVNDRLGERPVCLTYCPSSDAGLLFDASVDGERLLFGTSGLVYRGNKLLHDQGGASLWLQLAGAAVSGPRAAEEARLEPLPLTATTWGEWVALHPETRVLSPSTGYNRNYRPGEAYGTGREERGPMFPVWTHVPDRSRFRAKTHVWHVPGLGEDKIYVLESLKGHRVLMDRVGDVDVVLLPSRSGAVRMYRAGDRRLRLEDGALLDQDGVAYDFGEQALRSADGERSLSRLAGYRAYWFAYEAIVKTAWL